MTAQALMIMYDPTSHGNLVAQARPKLLKYCESFLLCITVENAAARGCGRNDGGPLVAVMPCAVTTVGSKCVYYIQQKLYV